MNFVILLLQVQGNAAQNKATNGRAQSPIIGGTRDKRVIMFLEII